MPSLETMMLIASLGLNIGTISAIVSWSNRLEHRLTKLETMIGILQKTKDLQ